MERSCISVPQTHTYILLANIKGTIWFPVWKMWNWISGLETVELMRFPARTLREHLERHCALLPISKPRASVWHWLTLRVCVDIAVIDLTWTHQGLSKQHYHLKLHCLGRLSAVRGCLLCALYSKHPFYYQTCLFSFTENPSIRPFIHHSTLIYLSLDLSFCLYLFHPSLYPSIIPFHESLSLSLSLSLSIIYSMHLFIHPSYRCRLVTWDLTTRFSELYKMNYSRSTVHIGCPLIAVPLMW